VTPGQLQKTVTSMREAFFPDWKDASDWKVEPVEMPPAKTGETIPSKKTIRIDANRDDLTVEVTVIHEICHAIGGLHGQGDGWIERMKCVVQDARKAGQDELAAAVDKDIFGSTEAFTDGWFYRKIREVVRRKPDADFDRLLRGISRLSGVPCETILGKCPRARKVYRDARRTTKCGGKGKPRKKR